jgi:3-hydroxyisobutyrate dehydrogenase
VSARTIALLGAGGTMGFPMARNLAVAGFCVRAWNRSREKAEPLTAFDAKVFDSPGQATADAEVLVTVLTNADAVIQTMALAVADTAPTGTVWLQMSTVGEEGTERCLELARERGLVFIDAPVTGTGQSARDGALTILASGSQADRPRLEPIFAVLGKRTVWAGEAGAGTRMKLAANAWLLAMVESVAETLALAQGLGIDPRLLLDAVRGGPLDSSYLQSRGAAMLAGDFRPSFKLALAAKDASLIEEAASGRDLDLPLFAAIRSRLEQGVAEHGRQDMTATFLTSAPKQQPGEHRDTP